MTSDNASASLTGRSRSVVQACARIATSRRFQLGIIAVIVLNAVTIGVETYPAIRESHAATIAVLDRVFLGIFAVEIGIRLVAFGRRPDRFFHSAWNVFDFLVVGAAFVPGVGTNLTVLRLVRVLRVVRLVSLMGDLRIVVNGLLRSLTSLTGVAVFGVVIVYVYAVAGTALFGAVRPEEWGTVGLAMLTCFRILTLENWDELYFPVEASLGWPATVFFLSFIVIATLVILNVVIAVVVSSVEQAREAELAADARTIADHTPELAARLAAMRAALDELEQGLASAHRHEGDH